MKPERELKDVLRDIQNLDLQRLNGTLSQREYERRRSVLDAEWKVPQSAPNTVYGVDIANGDWTTVVRKTDGVIITASDSTTKFDWSRMASALGRGMDDYANDALGYYSSYNYFYGSSPNKYSQLAQGVWDECEGVVMCECENMDCLRRIDITRDEYIKASSPGNARLTHPDCSYGIVNSKLIHRTPKWNIWWKGDQPGW